MKSTRAPGEAAARAKVESIYGQFMSGKEPAKKADAGKELLRAVFGEDSVAGGDWQPGRKLSRRDAVPPAG